MARRNRFNNKRFTQQRARTKKTTKKSPRMYPSTTKEPKLAKLNTVVSFKNVERDLNVIDKLSRTWEEQRRKYQETKKKNQSNKRVERVFNGRRFNLRVSEARALDKYQKGRGRYSGDEWKEKSQREKDEIIRRYISWDESVQNLQDIGVLPNDFTVIDPRSREGKDLYDDISLDNEMTEDKFIEDFNISSLQSRIDSVINTKEKNSNTEDFGDLPF